MNLIGEELIQVIDLGVSNLKSLTSALSELGKRYKLVSNGKQLSTDGSTILIPGNGNFESACRSLRQQDLSEKIVLANHTHGSKILGICLGMQILFEASDESSDQAGMGLIKEKIKLISKGPSEIVPVMGWRNVTFLDEYDDLSGWYYFAHSYGLEFRNQSYCVGHYIYKQRSITAAIRQQNIVGFQFHPEKSGPLGMSLLRRELQHD
jgi:glutamine amidotransferase